MAMTLHLNRVPARNGWLWIRHGFKVLQRRPLAISGLFASFLFLGFVLALLPVVGPVLLLMALPLLGLGFMLATHLVLQNQTPTLAVFLAPLKLTAARRRSQLVLCGAYAAATVLVMLLSNWVDAGAFDALQDLLAQPKPGDAAYERAVEAALLEPRLFWGMATRLGLAALVSVPFWHAPALVHWGGQGALQSLFSSTLGVWRNRAAFALNGLAWLGLLLAMGLAINLLVAVTGLPQLLPMLAMTLGLFASSAFYTSLYFTFVDCFMFGAPGDTLDDKPR